MSRVIGRRNVDKIGEITLTALGYSKSEECVCCPCMPASQILLFVMIGYDLKSLGFNFFYLRIYSKIAKIFWISECYFTVNVILHCNTFRCILRNMVILRGLNIHKWRHTILNHYWNPLSHRNSGFSAVVTKYLIPYLRLWRHIWTTPNKKDLRFHICF